MQVILQECSNNQSYFNMMSSDASLALEVWNIKTEILKII